MAEAHTGGQLLSVVVLLGAMVVAVPIFRRLGLGSVLGYLAAGLAIGASGFVLTSTAIVMQLLAERGDIALPRGQRIVSVLLFEDLMIVPLLAIVAFMSPVAVDHGGQSRWVGIGIGVGALAGLIAAG